jgi:nitrite reductase/ring-hydroxylating ferredoxin subunit
MYMAYVAVMRTDQLWEGETSGVMVACKPILLVRIGERVHAYEDRCLHQRVLLSRGTLEGTRLRCPAHGWEYDLTTGESLNPCGYQLQRYATCIEQGEIWVDVHNLRSAAGHEHG